jgi:hypothetical protein
MTLHVTNGDSAVGQIERSGVQGDVLPWRDVLHEGPVPADLGDGELRQVRARFLADAGWAGLDETLAWLAERDEALDAADQVVLWFEADLYDQLQLLQVLDRLARSDGRPCEIVYAQQPGDEGFVGHGELSPRRLAELHVRREPVGATELELGARGWEAFRSPDPRAVERVVEADTGALPFLGNALARLLEELPAAHDGLARSERTILEQAVVATTGASELFAASAQREERPYLGDATFFSYLDRLAAGEPALLERVDGGYRTTAAGRAVLAGEADAVRLRGVDRWLGGVHLSGTGQVWRWDASRRRVV